MKRVALFVMCMLAAPLALAAVDLTSEINLWSIAFAAGFAGMLGHYIKKFVRKEIEGSLLDYFVTDHWRNSVAAISTLATALGAVLYAHGFDGMTVSQVIWAAAATGFGADSAMNKATPAPSPAA
jgi:hypothetical protein